MIKKWMWITPLTIAVAGAVTGAVVGGYVANKDADPYRIYSATPVGSSNSDMIQVYFASAVNGTRLLLLPGYSHTSPLVQALSVTPEMNEPMYNYLSKTGFVLLDDKYGFPIFDESTNKLATGVNQPIWTSQVASAQFRTDLGSFVVGIAAGEFLNEYQYYFAPNPEDKLTWATYGGDSFSSVTGYMGGLQRGIAFFNKFIAPYAVNAQGKSYKPVEQVFLSNDYAGNFAGNFNPTGGNNLIELFLNKKVNLLVPVAGGQTQQAVRLIKQMKTKTIVLGVDSAVEDDTSTNLDLFTPGSQEVNGSTKIGGTDQIIQFSSIKNLTIAAESITNNIEKGVSDPNETGNGLGGFGYHSLGTTQNKCTGISPAGYPYFVKAMKILEKLYITNDVDKPSNDKKFTKEDWNTMPHQNDANANNPNSENFADIWEKSYEEELEKLEKTKIFKDLNESSSKVYYAFNGWETNTPPANGKNSWSYADLPNEGSWMMPLDEYKLESWFSETYCDKKPITEWDEKHKTMYASLQQWFKDNKKEIDYRKNFSLKGVLTAENYEKNHALIKVVVSTPVSPLLDKGFCESAYLGMVRYWKERGINVPSPKK